MSHTSNALALRIVPMDASVPAVSSGGKTVGKLTYLLTRRKGLSHIIMPTLTHFLGPALLEGEGSANTRFPYVAGRLTILGHIRRGLHSIRDPLLLKFSAK
jgi:hypothetical protein